MLCAVCRSLIRDREGRQATQQEAAARANPFSSFLTTFGAVPVSGFNLHKMLAQVGCVRVCVFVLCVFVCVHVCVLCVITATSLCCSCESA